MKTARSFGLVVVLTLLMTLSQTMVSDSDTGLLAGTACTVNAYDAASNTSGQSTSVSATTNTGQFTDWQKTLESHFDIVETFDQLQDWYGTIPGGVVTEINNPEDMPKKLDGSSSMWGLYSQYYDGPNQHLNDWIGDHGSEYNWRSNKSACINYPPLYCDINVDDVKGYGSERLGTYFGDGTPESGYHDIHVFFMMKFHDGFWALKEGSSNEFMWPPVIKMFDCVTGFENVHNYAENCCQSNIQHEYGTNFTLYNAGGGGLSRPEKLYFIEGSDITSWDSDGNCWRYSYERNVAMHNECRFDAEYLAHKWIGVEYHLNLGTLGNSDGQAEFWLYDEEGNQIGYYNSGPVLMQTHFAYNYNKMVFGGNYQCAGDTECPGETRWYFDDLIVDDQRIGPKYYNLLNQQSSLALNGAPADEAIHLSWTVNITLPVTSTWQITYDGPAGDQPSPISGIINPTRTYTLTGLTNYTWYTVTLNAMLDSTPWLSDTVRVMPTDIFVYLPLVMRGY